MWEKICNKLYFKMRTIYPLKKDENSYTENLAENKGSPRKSWTAKKILCCFLGFPKILQDCY